MVGKICKKILVLIILILIVEGIGLIGNNSYALSDVTDWIDEGWTPSVGDDSTLKQTTRTIVGTISAVGTIISVAALGIIGVKYMVCSVEEKANYKQTIVPWLLGSAMIFSVTIIPNIIYNLTDAVMYKDVVVDEEYYAREARKDVEKNTSKRSQYLAGRYDKLQEIKAKFLIDRESVLRDIRNTTDEDYESIALSSKIMLSDYYWSELGYYATQYFEQYMETHNYYDFGMYEVCDEVSSKATDIISPSKTIEDIINEMSIYFEMPIQDEENNKKDRKQGRVDAIQKIKEDLLRDKEAYKEEIKDTLEEDYEFVDQIHKSNLAYYYIDMLANSANMYYNEYIENGSHYKLGWYDIYSLVPDKAGDIMYSDKTVEEMISEMISYLEQMLTKVDENLE